MRIQPASQQPDLQVVTSREERVSYLTLLRNGNYFRFFLAQFVSSLGDWIGVIAIIVLAQRLGGPTAVGAVMTARVLPGFVIGPMAGVLADRWDRRRTMIVTDVCRAGLIFSLPFVENLLYLLFASMLLESLTLVWGPAKDASLPHFVSRSQLTHANSLNLIAIYGAFPLASVAFAVLATLGTFLAQNVPVLAGLEGSEEALALWVDSVTFLFSAAMIATLAIPQSKRRAGRLDLGGIRNDLVEGLRFVFEHKQVRPWLIGIALTFTAAGAVFSLGITFVEGPLRGGARGFAFLIGFLSVGMFIGLLSSGTLAQRVAKDVLFSSAILLLGAGLVGLASMGSLEAAIPFASALGFFAGIAYSTGYSLMHETTLDELRGRTFGAAYTVIRIGTLLGLGIFPFIAGAIGDHQIAGFFVPGTRITLWLAGAVAIGGGVLSMRAINAREFEREHDAKSDADERGYFVVFEGGEGAGKTTQLDAFVGWMQARGEEVTVTREPGGTKIGERIRAVLLDADLEDMDARTEALLYAADRAQHVAEVIRPALEQGVAVVSDRFLDSSLAYQGIARGLGLERIYEISTWVTDGLLPDLVFYLKLDADEGLGRSDERPDRIEREGSSFHQKVGAAYEELARQFPQRFVVIDAGRPASEVHREIVTIFEEKTSGRFVSKATWPPGKVPR